MSSMLEIIDVHRTYLIGESTVNALRGVSLTIECLNWPNLIPN